MEISGVPAAINARKTLCVGSAYNENRTDTKDLLVLDKTRYQSNAVVQPLAAQSGSSLSQQGREQGTLLNSDSLARKPLASSGYVRVPEARCAHKWSI